MSRRRRKTKAGKWVGRAISALLALPALYLLAAVIGSLVPVNRGWTEPATGTTIYIADNGIHADIIMPVNAQGLDWRPLIRPSDFASPDPNSDWIAFGSGEQRVYLNTPTWWDITPRTVMLGLDLVDHVEHDHAGRDVGLVVDELAAGFVAAPHAEERRARPGLGLGLAQRLGGLAERGVGNGVVIADRRNCHRTLTPRPP